jgi:hypothetical protein
MRPKVRWEGEIWEAVGISEKNLIALKRMIKNGVVHTSKIWLDSLDHQKARIVDVKEIQLVTN